jgi:hypothetical protein
VFAAVQTNGSDERGALMDQNAEQEQMQGNRRDGVP